MNVRENHSIIIDNYPFASSLNAKLLSEVDLVSYPLSFKTNVQARMSTWKTRSDNLTTLENWIYSLIKNNYDLKGYGLKFVDMWYARYDKGNYADDSLHPLSWLSFVYFVKCPRGSSPLILNTSGKRIRAEEGKIVIFPSWIRHSVPKNRCDDRVVVAGNIMLLRM